MNKYKWEWDDELQCWLCGTPRNGAGVCQSKPEEWFVNIVIRGFHKDSFGPFKNPTEAKVFAEKELDSYEIDFGEDDDDIFIMVDDLAWEF